MKKVEKGLMIAATNFTHETLHLWPRIAERDDKSFVKTVLCLLNLSNHQKSLDALTQMFSSEAIFPAERDELYNNLENVIDNSPPLR
jgi:hypothetical protein